MKKILLLTGSLFIGTNLLIAQTFGNSLHFDGADDYVSAPLPAVFSDISSNDITIEAWVKPQGNSFSRILFAQLSTSSFVSVSLSPSNQVYLYVNNISNASTSSLPLNQWTHIACIWDASTSQRQIYFNGVLQNTSSGGGSSTGTNNLMAIGGRTDGSQYFSGEIDELRIWNVKRTLCEIKGYMGVELATNPANLAAYYDFNQGIGGGSNTGETSLPDFTTNYNGTLNNFTLSGTTSNWLTSGVQYSPNTGIDTQTTCGPFTWIDGVTYTESDNTATHTIIGGAADGCDSVVTLNLTINLPTSSTITETACGSYTLNGQTYIASGTYTQTLTNAVNCDSTITLNLTINEVDNTVSVSGITLIANQAGAAYQWLDCDNGNTPISGAVSQSFTPIANGNYAVEVTANGCTETSSCISVNSVDLKSLEQNAWYVSPNPNNGVFTITSKQSLNNAVVEVYSSLGQLVYRKVHSGNNLVIDLEEQPNGVYILKINDQLNYRVVKI